MSSPTRFDRYEAWLLPVIAAITPFIVVYTLVRPHVGQSYFFRAAVLLAMFQLGVAWAMGWRRMPRRVTFPGVLIALFLFSIIASLPSSMSPLYSLKEGTLLLCGFLYFGLIVMSPLRRVILARTTWIVIGLAVVLSGYGILQHFGFEVLPYSDQIRKNTVIATIGHPNHLSSFLGPAAFLALSCVLNRRSRLAAGWLIAIILLVLACIVLARTRSIWLGLIVGLLTLLATSWLYAARHRTTRRMVYAVAGGFAACVVILTVMIAVLLPALGARIDLRERITSNMEVQSRFYYWTAAIDLARDQPFFGQGYAMFDPHFWPFVRNHQQSDAGVYYRDLMPAISGTNPAHVHNEYLEIFAEQGFLGLMFLLGLIGYYLFFGVQAAFRIPGPTQASTALTIYAGFVVALVDAMLSYPWRLPVSLLVFMLLLAWLHETIHPAPATDRA